MNCQDAREHFSALPDGHIGLTEQVPLEAHLRQCEACQQELEDLRTRERRRPHAWRPNLDFLRNRHLRLAATVMLAALAAVGVFRYRAERDVPVSPPPTAVPAPPALEKPSEVTAPAEQPKGTAKPPELPLPRRSPAPSLPVRDTRPTRPAKLEVSQLVQEAVSASTPPVAGDARPSLDVVGRLRVKSRSGAERDLAALLAKAGGTTMSWQRGEKITVIEAVIPKPSYGEFAEGLTRIGSWQIEAGRSQLPDPVRVTVTLAE
jgi:Putative zinc-finger